MELVSIIIPAYNSADFIYETLSSISGQTYQNLEVIVVDDGSTDSTGQIVRCFSDEIILVDQQNCGRGASRNNGVYHARGKYIAFLDHDDVLLKDSVAERVGFLDANPDTGWVFTDAIEFDKTGDLRLFLDQFPWLDLSKCNFSQVLKGCFPLMSTVMIRSDLIGDVGGFNIGINYGDDLELFLRLFLVSKVGMIRLPLTRRRIHPTQGVSSTFDRWHSRVGIYKNFRPSLGDMTIPQKRALKAALKHSFYKLGECYWGRDDFASARKSFLSSLEIAPHALKAFAYAVLCTAPPVIRMLRRLKYA
jgi:glycosyltransferase involved in cell wall biosynthesis